MLTCFELGFFKFQWAAATYLLCTRYPTICHSQRKDKIEYCAFTKAETMEVSSGKAAMHTFPAYPFESCT